MFLGAHTGRQYFKDSWKRAVITVCAKFIRSNAILLRRGEGRDQLLEKIRKWKCKSVAATMLQGVGENVVWVEKWENIPSRVQVKCDFMRLYCTFYATLIHFRLTHVECDKEKHVPYSVSFIFLYIIWCCFDSLKFLWSDERGEKNVHSKTRHEKNVRRDKRYCEWKICRCRYRHLIKFTH